MHTLRSVIDAAVDAANRVTPETAIVTIAGFVLLGTVLAVWVYVYHKTRTIYPARVGYRR